MKTMSKMSKAKVKRNHNNQVNANGESESDESSPSTNKNLDLSLLRKPIETSVTGFEEVLRAYEAGTNEVS